MRDPSSGSGNCGRECCPVIFAEMTASTPFRDILHAANLRNGTDGFTSPPKEGVLRIFSPLKIRRLRLGLNPRTWVLKASTITLDHRSSVPLYTTIITFPFSSKTQFCCVSSSLTTNTEMDFITEDQNSQCSFLLSHVTQPAKPSALDSTDHSRSSKTNTNYW